MITEEYKAIAAKQFNTMHINYPGAFFRGGFGDMPMAIAEWIKSLVSAGVQEVEIKDFVEFIINKYPKTKNVPPKNSEIVTIYEAFRGNSLVVDNPEPKTDIDESIYDAYRYLNFKYDRLFKGEGFTREEHFQLWSEDLKGSGATAKGIRKAIEKIKRSVDYSQYPPNISQFSMLALVLSMDENIPMPQEALNIALSNRELSSFHPIISHVRSIVGYERLIQNTRFVANIFEKEYQEAIIKLSNGQLDLSVQVESSQVSSEPIPRLSSDAVADELLELLKASR